MSEHYPRPDVRTKEQVLADEEACLANFDRLQRFFVLGRFINRDAFLPRRHRPQFLSAVGLMLLGVLVLVAGLAYFFGSLHNASRSNNVLVLLSAMMVCGFLCLLPPFAFPFRTWNGNAVLPAAVGDQWIRRRLVALLPGIALAGLVTLLRLTGLWPFAGLAFLLAVTSTLAALYTLGLWRTPKFVEPGFEERWIEEKMGKQKHWLTGRRLD